CLNFAVAMKLRDVGALANLDLNRVAGSLQLIVALQLVAELVGTTADAGVLRRRIVRRTPESVYAQHVFVQFLRPPFEFRFADVAKKASQLFRPAESPAGDYAFEGLALLFIRNQIRDHLKRPVLA